MVAYTTTYNLKKPTVADDEDVWGGYLNDSMDIIDDVLDGTVPVTGIDINSGTLDNVVIGGTNANTGTFTVLTANTSLGVTGNITVSGTVDGRDVAADGTKLDGIESGATADQTKADIDALGIAASTAATLATARNIALTGAVTGNVNFDGSGNVSITTTATSDPTLTLNGDVSGSATFTNLGNATLTVTVADDSHNHVISNVDGLQTALDGKLSTSGKAADSNLLDGINSTSFLRSDTSDTFTTLSGTQLNIGSQVQLAESSDRADLLQITSSTSSWGGLQIRNSSNEGRWSFMTDGENAGIYNDEDNQWHIYMTEAAGVDLRHAATSRLNTTSSGANVTGTLTTDGLTVDGTTTLNGTLTLGANVINDVEDIYLRDRIFHDGDTDTYMQFHAANQWRVVTGGTEMLEVNDTYVQLGAHLNANGKQLIEVEDIGLRDRIFHDGDTDTYIQFGGNTINFRCGNVEEVEFNTNGLFIQNSALHEDYDALSGTSVTVDPNTGGAWSLTMTGNTTFTFGGTTSGYSTGIIIELTGNGGTVTWPSSVDWAGGTAPDAPASGEKDIYVFWTRDGGTTWYGVQSIDAAA